LTEYFTNLGVHEVQKKIYDTELITLNISFCNCWKFITMYLVQYPPHQNTNTHFYTRTVHCNHICTLFTQIQDEKLGSD